MKENQLQKNEYAIDILEQQFHQQIKDYLKKNNEDIISINIKALRANSHLKMSNGMYEHDDSDRKIYIDLPMPLTYENIVQSKSQKDILKSLYSNLIEEDYQDINKFCKKTGRLLNEQDLHKVLQYNAREKFYYYLQRYYPVYSYEVTMSNGQKKVYYVKPDFERTSNGNLYSAEGLIDMGILGFYTPDMMLLPSVNIMLTPAIGSESDLKIKADVIITEDVRGIFPTEYIKNDKGHISQ